MENVKRIMFKVFDSQLQIQTSPASIENFPQHHIDASEHVMQIKELGSTVVLSERVLCYFVDWPSDWLSDLTADWSPQILGWLLIGYENMFKTMHSLLPSNTKLMAEGALGMEYMNPFPYEVKEKNVLFLLFF